MSARSPTGSRRSSPTTSGRCRSTRRCCSSSSRSASCDWQRSPLRRAPLSARPGAGGRVATMPAASIHGMRDYLDAISRRVVVYDGGMGATLEQFDLTQEDYGGLQGKCHEALILNRPDVIEGVHSSMHEAGAEVLETDTFQGSRIKLAEWGLADYTVEINTKAAE